MVYVPLCRWQTIFQQLLFFYFYFFKYNIRSVPVERGDDNSCGFLKGCQPAYRNCFFLFPFLFKTLRCTSYPKGMWSFHPLSHTRYTRQTKCFTELNESFDSFSYKFTQKLVSETTKGRNSSFCSWNKTGNLTGDWRKVWRTYGDMRMNELKGFSQQSKVGRICVTLSLYRRRRWI